MTDLFDQPTRRAAREQRKGKKRARTALLILVSLAVAVAAGMWAVPRALELLDTAPDDFAGPGHGEVVFEIPSGSSGTDIADILVENGVVASRDAAISALNGNPESSAIQAGAYELMLEMRAEDAVAHLLLPDSRAEMTLTVPEGFVYWQVFERMESTFGFSMDEIEEAAEDHAGIGLPEEADGEIEGWLAPSTYRFVPSASPTDILNAMVSQTVSNLQSAEVPADEWQEVLIRASIVEKEGLPEYFGEVARVIDNRITMEDSGINGRLQMDATVNYGQGNTGGMPTEAELQEDTPYNTYLHPGLPPTAIGAPSIDAIRAVLNPPEGDWIYFVTVDLHTGETLFAATLEEHNANVQLLREWQAAQDEEEDGDE